MQPKLRLLRDISRAREHGTDEREDRFRYPVQEEIWEVSCEADWDHDDKPPVTRDQRRAS